jgi:hypothetical protein
MIRKTLALIAVLALALMPSVLAPPKAGVPICGVELPADHINC